MNLQGGGNAYYVCDAGGQRTRKVWEKRESLVEDRIYLGGWEIFRKRVNGEIRLERNCLHIMDDQQRIALIETKTIDTNNSSGVEPVVRYQLANHLGSAVLELGDAKPGQPVPMISYEEFHPFGTTTYHIGVESTEFSAKRYRYTGKERDEETGFSYHGARYKSSSLGRWINTDPIGIGDGVNLYGYVKNHSPLIVHLYGKEKGIFGDQK